MEKARLVKAFEWFADDCRDSSPLYEFLSREIMKDDELLELCTYRQQGQPAPNMILGAVHHLLLTGISHSLTQYYASLVDEVADDGNVFVHFKQFCQKYRGEIIHLMQTKLVQTNEVRRSAYLYPIFSYIYSITNKPLALIEVGTSAGLQLLWDQYTYSYGTNELFGSVDSSVKISAEIKGTTMPHLPEKSPPVSHRIGLDLHINDVTDVDDYLWLLSLIWPEHHERRQLFKDAAKMVKNYDLQLIEGDGIELLGDVSMQIPKTSTLCIFHTHVANQFSEEMKHRLIENVKKIGQWRDVFHFYNNMWDGDLHLDSIIDGSASERVIGKANSHGRWFTWELT